MGFKEVLQGALRGVRVAREHGETFNKAARFGAKLGVDVARAGGVGPYVDSKVIPFLGDLLDGKVRVEREISSEREAIRGCRGRILATKKESRIGARSDVDDPDHAAVDAAR
jgi:hypothetical protein